MPELSEQESFLKDLGVDKKDDVFEQPLSEESVDEPAKEESSEEAEQHAKNRRERRLLEKQAQLKEEAIYLNAKLQAEREAREALTKSSEESDFLKTVEGIYGNDEPGKAAATELLKRGFSQLYEQVKEKVKEETRLEREQERTEESQAVSREEDVIEEGLDRIQDNYNVELSDSDRKGYLTLLEKLSPKDSEGNIVEFADFENTYEIFERTKEKASSRAKDLASRSMNRSGASQDSKLESSAMDRYLRENGLIF